MVAVWKRSKETYEQLFWFISPLLVKHGDVRGIQNQTILWLKWVQSLLLQGCVEHSQGQAYKQAAALCYLTMRSFFRLILV